MRYRENYIKWIEHNMNHKLIDQIIWITNLTDTWTAQEIFNIWYKEMIEKW